MAKFNNILYGILGLSLAFIVMLRLAPTQKISKRVLTEMTPTPTTNTITDPYEYEFNNPKIAKLVLSELDVFQPIDDSYFASRFGIRKHYDEPFFGMKKHDDYCEKQRNYFVEHPESVFNQTSIFNTRSQNALLNRRVIPEIGFDPHPKVDAGMGKSNTNRFLYNMRKDINLFFTTKSMYEFREIGRQFSCLAQTSNHIPGHQTLNRKDFVAENVIKYAQKFEKRPQCFNFDKFFPETWVLYNEQDCVKFFEVFNSEQYQIAKKERRIVYIRKVGSGSHRGLGVQPVNEEEEQALRILYENGKKCGQVTKNYIIQSYVHNPLLLNGRKFDFRMYMLIASSNPMMAYYHDGFLRVSLRDYDVNSDEKNVLMTNLALNKQIYDDVQSGELFNGMDEENLKLEQQWSFDRLQAYLLEKKIIADRDWLENYLRPEFKKAMIHLLRSSSYAFLSHSSLYELYGVDFMLDENLNLWFLEANSGPGLDGYSQPMEKFIVKMIKDHFEIVMGLLRSRMKRVIGFVNRMVEEGQVKKSKNDGIVINDIEMKKMEFAQITQNYFEREFRPSPTNGFELFWDGNQKGAAAYQGFISPDCL